MTDWPVPGQQRGTWGTQLVEKIEEELGERDEGLADHLANESNPHNVTAEQVGLGNILNPDTAGVAGQRPSVSVDGDAVWINEQVLDVTHPMFDGVSQTETIANVITAAAAGDTIWFPKGTYTGDGSTRHVVPAGVTVAGSDATLAGVLFELSSRSRVEKLKFTGAHESISSPTGASAAAIGAVVRGCHFDTTSYGVRLRMISNSYNQNESWIITDNTFENCNRAIYIIGNRNIIERNRIINPVSPADERGIVIIGGARNRVAFNTIYGGVTGIQIISTLDSVGRYTPYVGNVIHGNTVWEFTEEGIALDVRGNDSDDKGVKDWDTVSATGPGSSGRVQVTLGDAGWAAYPGATLSNYYATFISGALAGRSYKITTVNSGTGQMEFTTADMPSADHVQIVAGDVVVIGMPFLHNIISSNYVDAYGAQSGHNDEDGNPVHSGIILFGNSFNTSVVGNTVVNGDISTWNAQATTAASPGSYANSSIITPSMFNTIAGNAVSNGKIHLAFRPNGATTAVTPYYGNVVSGNSVPGGTIRVESQTAVVVGNFAKSYTYTTIATATTDTYDEAPSPALTAATGGAINSGDATTDTEITNMRTRIAQIESAIVKARLVEA
jgi:hypothetical protein